MPAHKRRLPAELTGSPPGTLATASHCDEGVCELRIDWGPGYRVYYAMLGKVCVLLPSAAATNENSRPTLTGRWSTSKIIKKGAKPHET